MTTTMNRNELNNNELEMVNGGFKFGDRYSDPEYAAHGIKHESNWFSKDKYTLPDGTVTDHEGAVKFMLQFEDIQEKERNMKVVPNNGPTFMM